MLHKSGIFASFPSSNIKIFHFSSQFVIINLIWHTFVEFWPCLHFCRSVTLFTIVDASVHVYRASALCSCLLALTHAPLLVSMNMCSFSTFSRFLIPSVSARVQCFREISVHIRQHRLEFPQPLFAIDLYLLTALRCWCSVCAARVGAHFVAAALPVGRLLHRFCNGAVRWACCPFAAGVRLPALTVAAARPLLPLRLPGGPNSTAWPLRSVPLPWRRTSAKAACSPTMWHSQSHAFKSWCGQHRSAEVLVCCVIKPCCTFESLTLHHSASPPEQRIVLLRVRVLFLKATEFINSYDDTTASADLRSAACCCYRCFPSAATRSGARCRCHFAPAVSLCRSVSADPSASPCTPWIVLHLLPDLFVLDSASSNVMAPIPLRSTDTQRSLATRVGPVWWCSLARQAGGGLRKPMTSWGGWRGRERVGSPEKFVRLPV